MTMETRRAVRWRGIALAVAVLGAATALTWYASRGRASAPADGGHAHGAAAPSGAAQPVMLDSAQAARIGVTFAEVERGPLTVDVRTVGQVTYDETRVRTVSLKFDGWVEALHVDYTGQAVRRGDPLLTTYAPMLVSAEQELILAVRLLRDVAAADSVTVRRAEALVDAARERLRNWDVPQAEIARIEGGGEPLRVLEIRAPYSGVIVEKNVFEGQRVMPGEALYRIADLSRVWVEGEVFERDLPLIREGQRAEVDIAGTAGDPRTGRVVFIHPTVDAATRTTRVRVELDNADGRLRPGMYATLRLRTVARANTLHVPRSAVLSTGQRDLVFVRRADGMLEPREITRGVATDGRIEVRSGLQVGDVVVASATFLVDAESNLGAAVAAMAGMAGMEGVPGVKAPPGTPAKAASSDSAHQH